MDTMAGLKLKVSDWVAVTEKHSVAIANLEEKVGRISQQQVEESLSTHGHIEKLMSAREK